MSEKEPPAWLLPPSGLSEPVTRELTTLLAEVAQAFRDGFDEGCVADPDEAAVFETHNLKGLAFQRGYMTALTAVR